MVEVEIGASKEMLLTRVCKRLLRCCNILA
jgi:hypothetical protein